jgi:hypothetical protein
MGRLIDKLPLHPVYLHDWYYSQIKYPLPYSKNYYSIPDDSFVYVFYNEITKLYKIGMTKTPHRRKLTLSSQSGVKLKDVLLIQLHTEYDEPASLIEKKLHVFFKHRRVHGEWFDLDIRSLIAIRTLFIAIGGEWIDDYIKEHLKQKNK